jgi:hypothetical protein
MNSSAFRNNDRQEYDRMTGRQEYDRQRTLGKYMINSGFWPRLRARALHAPVFLSSLTCKAGRCAPPHLRPSQLRCSYLHHTLCILHCKGNSVIFLFWELRGLSPNFYIHVSVSDLYILRIGPLISSSRNGSSIVGIYNSLTDT